MRRWTGALGILISVLFVISLFVTSHSIVTDLGAAGEGAAPGALQPPLGVFEATQEVTPLFNSSEVLLMQYAEDQVVMENNPNLSGPDDYEYKIPAGRYHDVRGPASQPKERSFLKFDLSEIPPGSTIENAFLKLYHYYGVYDADEWCTIQVHMVENDSWQDSTIDWANQPPIGGMLYSELIDYIDASPYPWLGPYQGGPMNDNAVDVTSYVSAAYANKDDLVVSFALVSPQENEYAYDTDIDFVASETTDYPDEKPYLEIWGVPGTHGVLVEIDPGHAEGLAGGTLTYTVIVKNTGAMTDNYDLTINDDAGWSPTLAENRFEYVPAGEDRETTMSVTIPSNAELFTVDNITVTGICEENENVTNTEIVAAKASTAVKPPLDDAYVAEDLPDTNYEEMTLDDIGFEYAYKHYAYLKFDLNGIPYENIESARLVLFCSDVFFDSPQKYIDLVLCKATDDWYENTVTWNIKHDNGAALDTQRVDTEGREYFWGGTALTDYLKWEYANDPDKLASFVLRPFDNSPNSTSAQFSSKELVNIDLHPRLEFGAKAVQVAIEPKPPATFVKSVRDALAGGRPHFTVIVKNIGVVKSSYNLDVENTRDWPWTLADNQFENVEPGESRSTDLWISIPWDGSGAGRLTITATTYDATASGSFVCEARVYENRLYPPDDDSCVQEGIPENNVGSESDMYIQSFTGEPFKNERIFIKFDLGGIPAENYIESAKLYLWCFDGIADDVNAQAYAVENDSWDESTITWNNQPAYSDVIGEAALTSWPENVENTWIAWDVTSYVAGQHRYGDNIASFCVKAEVENTSGRYTFDTKEYFLGTSVHPYLEVILGPSQPAVDVSISPVHRIGYPNITVTYEVKVMNTGNVMDSYTLSKTDDEGWSMTLTPGSFADVPPGESRTATLSVTLPSAQGDEDSIQVTATGTASDSENCTASVRRAEGWEVAGYAPRIDNYGVAVTGVGSGSYIYVANSNTLGTRVSFMRYNTDTGEWDYRATPAISTPFKNGTVLAWDGGDNIYALLGGSYADVAATNKARHYFYRYKISTNEWDNLMPTGNTDDNASDSGAQGAGDALVVAGDYVYAIVGQNEIGSSFWRYDIANNIWESRTLDWASTDDGASLVWTSGDNLYALRGEWQETTPSKEFARYSISGNSWTSLGNIPEPGGVGDGASLLWIEGDNLYATGGSQAYEPAETEGIDDNFYTYSISGDSWGQLEDLPAGIGAQNGPRLGAGSDIYAWRGNDDDPVLWVYTLKVPVSGTAVISLLNLYTVNVEKILDLGDGSKLVVKFYNYGYGLENENVIESFTPPWHVEENESARHPEDIGVKIAWLDLTTDDTSNVIETLDTLVVTKVILESRFSEIPLEWALAPPAGKLVLEAEFSEIPLYWALAPS